MAWDDWPDDIPEDLRRPPAREPGPFDDGIPASCHECGGETTYGTLAVLGTCVYCHQAMLAREGRCACVVDGYCEPYCDCPCHERTTP